MNKLIAIPIVILISSIVLYLFSINAPKLNDDEIETIKFPQNLNELKLLAKTLKKYKTEHMKYVVILFCLTYLFKQSFAIPGSFMMNILAGAILGVTVGFPLVSLLTAIGATNAFLLSNYFAKEYVTKKFYDRILSFRTTIDDNKDGLFFILLSLRLFPMSPNWLMNIVSPILNIPITYFFFSVLIGLMPYNFICVQTGCILFELETLDDIITLSTMVKLFLIAVMVFLPSILIKRFRNKIKTN